MSNNFFKISFTQVFETLILSFLEVMTIFPFFLGTVSTNVERKSISRVYWKIQKTHERIVRHNWEQQLLKYYIANLSSEVVRLLILKKICEIEKCVFTILSDWQCIILIKNSKINNVRHPVCLSTISGSAEFL